MLNSSRANVFSGTSSWRKTFGTPKLLTYSSTFILLSKICSMGFICNLIINSRKLFLFFILSLCSYELIAQDLNIDISSNACVVVQIFDYDNNQIGHGSGFIIDPKGVVVTNYHVIDDAFLIRVVTQINNVKTTYEVKTIQKGSKDKDLAVLIIDNKYNKVFPFLKMAKKIPSKGTECWAIGTPVREDYMNTVSKGLVSNINIDGAKTLLQTNAEMSHGSSGGALINKLGEVIGVTSSGDPTEDGLRANINFAIWIGHINELPFINQQSIAKRSEIPGTLSFFTKGSSKGAVYIYLNRVYIGFFSKYFSSYVPNCGQEGTITRKLSPGTYQYQVFYAYLNKTYYGNITILPNDCRLVDIPVLNETQDKNNVYQDPTPLKYDREQYKWKAGSGLSLYDAGRPSIQLSIERFVKDKFSIRANFRIELFTGVGLDFRKYFSNDEPVNWYVAGSFLHMFDYFSWAGLKFGTDIDLSNRISLNGELGLGRTFDYGLTDYELNIMLNYRFGK